MDMSNKQVSRASGGTGSFESRVKRLWNELKELNGFHANLFESTYRSARIAAWIADKGSDSAGLPQLDDSNLLEVREDTQRRSHEQLAALKVLMSCERILRDEIMRLGGRS